MKTRALITGIGGFAASYLAEYLLEQGMEVCGTIRGHKTDNIEHLHSSLSLYSGDLMSASWVEQTIRETRPDLIFHLAAQASVARSWDDPAGTLSNNILSELNLLQGVTRANIDPRILVIGSNEEYGLTPPEELPSTEETPLRPINPYGVSKICQDFLGYQYFSSQGLHLVRVRPFNHTGPRQSDEFFIPSIARQIAEAEAGISEPVIYVGNLKAERDFTDVRDMVKAYRLAILYGKPGEVYNIGSGKATSLEWVVDFFLKNSRVNISVEQDQSRIRPRDATVSLCDYSKLKRETGWTPQIPLEHTLRDVLEYWRSKSMSNRRITTEVGNERDNPSWR